MGSISLRDVRVTANLPPNFYLMDEPTNHVDIPDREALESEIEAHGVTTLLVSHDRSFVRRVGTRYLIIAGKRLVEAESPEDFFAEMARDREGVA
jgi:ATPase subunit of ABC transporter with duplicated ATPase domains